MRIGISALDRYRLRALVGVETATQHALRTWQRPDHLRAGAEGQRHEIVESAPGSWSVGSR